MAAGLYVKEQGMAAGILCTIYCFLLHHGCPNLLMRVLLLIHLFMLILFVFFQVPKCPNDACLPCLLAVYSCDFIWQKFM